MLDAAARVTVAFYGAVGKGATNGCNTTASGETSAAEHVQRRQYVLRLIGGMVQGQARRGLYIAVDWCWQPVSLLAMAVGARSMLRVSYKEPCRLFTFRSEGRPGISR